MVSGLLDIVMIKWQFSPEMAIFLTKQKHHLESDWIQNFPIKSRTYYAMISIWSMYAKTSIDEKIESIITN